jgi:hypothetical protein
MSYSLEAREARELCAPPTLAPYQGQTTVAPETDQTHLIAETLITNWLDKVLCQFGHGEYCRYGVKERESSSINPATLDLVFWSPREAPKVFLSLKSPWRELRRVAKTNFEYSSSRRSQSQYASEVVRVQQRTTLRTEASPYIA